MFLKGGGGLHNPFNPIIQQYCHITCSLTILPVCEAIATAVHNDNDASI